MMDAGRHPLVEVLTCSEVLNVEGKQSLNSLYLSMLQSFDPSLTEFNNADKPLGGIELA